MRIIAAAVGLLVVSSALAGQALFPAPLHIVRRIDDPLAATTATIHQYCYGSRIITINGPRVAIADFEAQTLTEIDHARFTYSVSSFDDIAKSQLPKIAPNESKTARQIAIDHSVNVSRDALEALIGAAYPNTRTAGHDEIIRAAGNGSPRRIVAQSTTPTEQTYGIPSDETVTYENGLTTRNAVVLVNDDLPPASAILIDPGATRVESRLTRLRRELEQLDTLPTLRP